MPLHIRDEKALVLARKLAARRGVTLTRVVVEALEGELQRDAQRRPLGERARGIAERLAAQGTPGKRRAPTKAQIDALWGND